MNLQKYNNRDFFNAPSSFNNLLDLFFSEPVRSFERKLSDFLSPTSSVSEEDKFYTISIDLPGVKKEDINVEMQDGTLRISGERKETSKGDTLINEVRYGQFQRSFKLPHLADNSKVNAELKDGQLNIKVEKSEKEQRKTIPIT